ncbi:MAG: hypothetical protein GY859_10065 [Desulfobacterales bacterium]|nr:hypothetical protein [Desulfobacterales bacterium]
MLSIKTEFQTRMITIFTAASLDLPWSPWMVSLEAPAGGSPSIRRREWFLKVQVKAPSPLFVTRPGGAPAPRAGRPMLG